MLPYEFPWWFARLLGIVFLMLYGDFGFLLGFVLVYLLTGIVRATRTRSARSKRFGYAFLGGVGGAR